MKAAIILQDTNNVKDWSGVPYYASQAFLLKYKNAAIVIETKKYLNIPELLFNLTLKKLYKFYYGLNGVSTSYSFMGSWLYRLIIGCVFFIHRNKINEAEYLLAFNAPYGSRRWIKVPIVAFSDGSYEFLVKWQKKRELVRPEKIINKANYKSINNAALIICLFQQVYDDLISRGFPVTKLHYFPGGINLPSINKLTTKMKQSKYNNQMLLFIGRKHYKDGAIKLIEAFKILKPRIPQLKLTILGLSLKDLEIESKLDNMDVIPYLDKNSMGDLKIYENLLSEASLFINVASIGGAYMATLEAMAYGTPIILKSYPEIVSFLNNKSESGKILTGDITVDELCNHIMQLLTDFNIWSDYSTNAGNIANDLTWEGLFIKIESLLEINIKE